MEYNLTRRRIWRRVVLFAALGSLFPLPAFAYIDPGTGTYAIQAFLAVIAGAAVSLRLLRQWIAGKFSAVTRALGFGPARPDMDKPAPED